MNRTNNLVEKITSAAALLLLAGGAALAQDSQERPTLDKTKQQQQQQSPQNTGNTLTLDTSAQTPASSEEDTALKAVTSMPEGSTANMQAKLTAAEDFLKKYPESRYRIIVYPFLTIGYVQIGQADKALAFGDKELEINPNDVATMAVMSQTIPRVYNASAPDA